MIGEVQRIEPPQEIPVAAFFCSLMLLLPLRLDSLHLVLNVRHKTLPTGVVSCLEIDCMAELILSHLQGIEKHAHFDLIE